MKKIGYKKILFVILLAIVIFSISTISMATFTKMNPQQGAGTEQMKSIANIILGILQVIAVGTAVIMLVILAIKYMTAAPSEKGEIKKSLTIYIIGALVLFAGAGILKIIEVVASDINGATNGGKSSTSTSTVRRWT